MTRWTTSPITPNVGPFMAKRLIQFLVTSNPSPAYMTRVVAVWNNNGSGVRGDLKAVVRAILLDDEARNPSAGQRDLRQAARADGALRALRQRDGGKSKNGRNSVWWLDSPMTTSAVAAAFRRPCSASFSPFYTRPVLSPRQGWSRQSSRTPPIPRWSRRYQFFSRMISDGGNWF